MESVPRPRWGWKSKLFSAFALWGIVNGGLHLWQRSQVEAYYAEMRAQGLPTNTKELDAFYQVSEGVTDSSNEWIPALDEASDAIMKTREPESPPLFINDEIRELGQPWEQLNAAEEFLNRLAPQIQNIHRATEIGGQARFSDSSGHHRDVAKLLVLEAAVATHRGESARSLKAVKAILAMANAKRGQPDMIDLMSSGGIRDTGISTMEIWLPHTQWADEDLASLQELICEVDFRREFQNALAGDSIRDLEGLEEEGRFPFRTINEKEYLQQYSDARKELSLPWHEMISRFRRLDSRVESLKGNRFAMWTRSAFVKYAPRLEMLSQVMAYAAARQTSTNVGLAAQRYRLRYGRLPTSLGEIEPDLFGKLPDGTVPLIDPFDGQPLRFNLNELRLVIYSVGMNETDEGGVKVHYPDAYKDIGFTVTRK